MNPLADAFAQWVAAFANGLLTLDPVARARLARLDGRAIALRPDPPVEPVTIRFVGSRIVVARDESVRPSAIVSGDAGAMLAAFARGRFDGTLAIEGDEDTIAEFADTLRELSPDFAAPLGRLVGSSAASQIAGFVELGFETARRVLTDLGAQASKVARDGAAQQFLTRAELDAMSSRRHAAALALDRIAARLNALERSGSETP